MDSRLCVTAFAAVLLGALAANLGAEEPVAAPEPETISCAKWRETYQSIQKTAATTLKKVQALRAAAKGKRIRWQGKIQAIQCRAWVWRYRTDNRTHHPLGFNVWIEGDARLDCSRTGDPGADADKRVVCFLPWGSLEPRP